ncbi:MAG: mandelate racemase/muconate lactonizing enzyme family protein [Geminicoccaceae bacterium]
MKITAVDAYVVLAPNYDAGFTSSAQDSFVVIIRTDEGLEGIGESDVNPWIAKACLEAPGTHTMGLCMKELLLGADPSDIEGIWKRIYLGTAMNGRRGAVIHALGAVEMALWDLKGKAAGKPVHEVLGGAVRDHIVPYASLLPAGHSFEEYKEALCASAARAKDLGFKAVKAEVIMNGPYAHGGMAESDERHTEVVAAVRQVIGPDITLMVDVGYLWPDARTCLDTVKDWGEFDVFFLETPVWSDDLDELRAVAEEAPMPVAVGEWLATRHEFDEAMTRGRIQVAQPDVGRVGGLLEATKVCAQAKDLGVTIVPHCWKTGISISATAHLAFTQPHCAFIEYLPRPLCFETLRKELADEELRLVDGTIPLPTRPGLGFELNREALARYTVA